MNLDVPPKKPRGGCLRIIAGILIALPAINSLVLLLNMAATGSLPKENAHERLLLLLSMGAFSLVFGVGGLALIRSGARAIGRRYAIQAQIEASRPDEPWLWRPDWAAGRIVSGGPPIGLMVIAVLWNAFVWKVVAAEPLRLIREGRWDLLPVHALSAVLLAVGLHLARVALREMARWLRFRRVSLRLETLPGIIGGHVRGVIEAGGDLPAGAEPVVGISCTRVTQSGSGKRRKSLREVIWQEERPARNSSALAGALSIPVEFAIPSGLPESSRGRVSAHHVWKLRAHARIAGPDLQAEFEIPVFNTGAGRDASDPEPSGGVEGS